MIGRRREARLAKLELTAAAKLAAAQGQVRAADEGNARFQAAWEIMQSTMSEEHARLVVEAYAAGFQHPSSPGFNSPSGRLLRRCLEAISRREYAHGPCSEIVKLTHTTRRSFLSRSRMISSRSSSRFSSPLTLWVS